MKQNRTFSAVIVILTLLILSILPPYSYAQWQRNGIEIPNLVQRVDVVPGPDNSVWVLQGLLAGPSYAVSYLQRYDEDGYPMFDQPGIRATVRNVVSDPMGILPTSDGGVIVGFIASLDEWYGSSVYGQRLNADGERMWGDNGAAAALTMLNADRYPQYPTLCSDGDDGFWCYFFDSPGNEIYACGLNNDGSEKTRDPIHIRQDVTTYGDKVLITPGDNGGMYLAFRTGTYSGATSFQHVNADGSLRWEEWPILFGRSLSNCHSYIIGSRDNALFGICGGQSFFDVYCSDRTTGEHLWNDYIRFSLGTNTLISNPVILPDGSLCLITTCFNTDQALLTRIQTDGTPYYEDYTVDLDYNGGFNSGRYLSISNDSTFIYCIYKLDYGFSSEGFRAQRIDLEDGTECWHDSVLIIDPFEGTLFGSSTVTSNNELVLIARDSDFNGFLYKVYSDGSVAGRPDVVPDQEGKTNSPSEFRIDSLYPNPTNHEVIVTYITPLSGPLTCTLFTLTGQQVQQRVLNAPAGASSFSFDLGDSKLASGSYFISLNDGAHTVTRKIVYLQ